MEKLLVFSILIVCLWKHETRGMNLPGPLVYVVTPSPKPAVAQGRAAPFYYHNWMRRMDPPNNVTTTTTRKPETPDLIFAEFESGNKMKSVRKLLEKEKIETRTTTTTTTTQRPIYMPDDSSFATHDQDFGIPIQPSKKKEEEKPVDMTDYFALYNNQYSPKDLVPVYVAPTAPSTTTSTTPTTTPAPIQDVQNVWHIIDSQKYDQYPGKWQEEPVPAEDTKNSGTKQEKDDMSGSDEQEIDDNFALPGFATNPGNAGENESRAIHSEHNMRFPYVNLKPFQMKTPKKPLLNTISNSKKGTDMINLDNFHDLKNPVRGEAQDVVPARKPIDRYNPAQPYLPVYSPKAKQSAPNAPPKAVANLVPPPPPPPPRVTDDDFPVPDNYESFPPFAPPAPPVTQEAPPPPAPAAPKPSILYEIPDDSSEDTSDESGPPDTPSDSDSPPVELEYHYKPPPPVETYSAPAPPPPPPPKVYGSGYSYDKPEVVADTPTYTEEKEEYDGYHYDKPEPPPPPPPKYLPPPSYDYVPTYGHHHHYKPYGYKPATSTTEMPRVNRYSYYYLGKKLYYLPLYFSVYFIVYVGALIIKAVLRHKIVYPNSWRPNDQTAGFFSKRSVDSWDLSKENLHEITGKVTHAIAVAGEKYFAQKKE